MLRYKSIWARDTYQKDCVYLLCIISFEVENSGNNDRELQVKYNTDEKLLKCSLLKFYICISPFFEYLVVGLPC